MNNQLALIIEDDPDLSIIFAEALPAAEFETKIIQDGRVALACLAEDQPVYSCAGSVFASCLR